MEQINKLKEKEDGGKISYDIGYFRRKAFKSKCATDGLSMLEKLKQLIDKYIKG